MGSVKVVNLSEQNSLVSQYVSELRDVEIQNDRLRFRRNLERIGEITAYEISRELKYKEVEVTTPLAKCNAKRLVEQPVIATILRAGLPLHQGLLNYFDCAENAFISAYRKHAPDGAFHIEIEYRACPKLDNKILIVTDPMLATGASIVLTLEKLMSEGAPRYTHIVTAIASQPGIDKVRSAMKDTTIWAAAIDPKLNDKAYIVPGLGDAGDLAFGEKAQS